MTTTIIKHEQITPKLYAVVITTGMPMKALFQVYSIHGYQENRGDMFNTVLEKTESWSTESGAIEAMRYWIDMNTSATGNYIGSV